MKKILIILRHSPYGNSLSKLGIDLALSCAAFGQEVNILLMGDGGLQLITGQNSEPAKVRSHIKILSSLPFYDIDNIYVLSSTLSRSALSPNDLGVNVTIIDPETARTLITRSDHVVGF